MESLGYFPVDFGRAAGAETTLEPKDKFLVFESLFAAGLCLPFHGLFVDVLERYKVQIHQLTLNVMVPVSEFSGDRRNGCDSEFFIITNLLA